jgi:hypothetical protein
VFNVQKFGQEGKPFLLTVFLYFEFLPFFLRQVSPITRDYLNTGISMAEVCFLPRPPLFSGKSDIQGKSRCGLLQRLVFLINLLKASIFPSGDRNGVQSDCKNTFDYVECLRTDTKVFRRQRRQCHVYNCQNDYEDRYGHPLDHVSVLEKRPALLTTQLSVQRLGEGNAFDSKEIAEKGVGRFATGRALHALAE